MAQWQEWHTLQHIVHSQVVIGTVMRSLVFHGTQTLEPGQSMGQCGNDLRVLAVVTVHSVFGRIFGQSTGKL